MLREHSAGEVFDLAEGDRLEAARALKAQRETADARKQVQRAEHQFTASADWCAVTRTGVLVVTSQSISTSYQPRRQSLRLVTRPALP